MREVVSPHQTQDAGVSTATGAFTPLAVGPDAGLSDDVALAVALARTARSVAHVVDVSAGRYGVAATYGPGQRIVGIVVRRVAPTVGNEAPSCVVEAHVVIATAVVAGGLRQDAEQRSAQSPRARAQSATGAPGVSGRPILLRIADDIRRALAQELREMRPAEPWTINVSIDDLRDAEATSQPGMQ
jgi:hypothetical protein